MPTKRKSTRTRAKAVTSRRAAKEARTAISGNGMKTFGFHAYDSGSAKMVSALKEEVTSKSMASFGREAAAGEAPPVDPETSARAYLAQALASKSVPSLVAPESATGGTDFKVINTETIPLTGTTMVKFRQRFNDVP